MRVRDGLAGILFLSGATLAIAACGWDPSRPFDREAPAVNDAIRALDAGDIDAAARTLQDYLSTGACSEGNIGTPELLKKKPNGAFDLGLSLFRVGEAFGRRFGEEEDKTGPAIDEPTRAARTHQIDCALRIVRAIGESGSPPDVRARARYLEGNLLFLNEQYEEAVRAYDQALTLSPGQVDAGDPVGRDAAWNRAIALRRIEDKKDAGPDASQDASQDAPQDGPSDGAGEGGGDSGQDSSAPKDPDAGDSGAPDAGQDASPPPKNDPPDAALPPPSKANQDERMLDQLENAPTVQQETAKKAAQRRKVRGMADK